MNTHDTEDIQRLAALPIASIVALGRRVEERAAARYSDLAREMRAHGNEDAGTVFDWLAREEASHIDAVEELGRSAGADAEPEDALPVPPGEADGADESYDSGPYLLTAYEAFDEAVRNESRAFEFFRNLAAYAEDDAVREFAESLAKEEIRHLALCRLGRRRAFRAALADRRIEYLQGQAISDEMLADVRREISARLVSAYRAAEHTARHQGDADAAATMAELASRFDGAERTGAAEKREIDEVHPAGLTFLSLRNALKETPAAFPAFESLASGTADERVLNAAQDAASVLLEPMRIIREHLDGLRPFGSVA